jgi:hypothetical protein
VCDERRVSVRDTHAVTADQWRILVEAGVIDTVEMLDGVAYMGRFPLQLSLEQAAVAAKHGVTVPSPVDAVLADPAARAEVERRLRAHCES